MAVLSRRTMVFLSVCFSRRQGSRKDRKDADGLGAVMSWAVSRNSLLRGGQEAAMGYELLDCLVGGFKHVFIFQFIYGMSSFPLTFICFKTIKNHQRVVDVRLWHSVRLIHNLDVEKPMGFLQKWSTIHKCSTSMLDYSRGLNGKIDEDRCTN